MSKFNTVYASASRAVLSLALLSLSNPAYAQSDETDEIIVTGARLLGGSIDDAITGVSVLSGDALADRLAPTIGETLKSEPGVSSTFFGAGASRPIIRGQGGDRVRVLTNGIGSIDASSASPDHAVAAEPAQAELVEVLRGASLLRFGSSGAGGIVNIVDGRIPSEVPEDMDVALRIGASSVDLGREVAGSIDKRLTDNLVLHLDGTWREADNYKIPGFAESEIFHEAEEAEHEEEHEEEGHDDEAQENEARDRLSNSWLESSSLTGGLSYVGDRGFIGVAVHKFDSQYGVPGGHGHGEEDELHDDEHEEDEHNEDAHEEEEDGHEEGEEEAPVSIDLDQVRLDLNAVYELGGFFERIQLNGGYADYKHTELEGAEIGTVFENEGWETRLELVQAENNGWRAAYGLQLRNRDFSAIGAEAFVPPTETQQIGIYTFQEKDIDDLHLEAALRFENTELENSLSGAKQGFDLWSISGGGDVHLTEEIRLGGSVFRTERAPTAEELFSNGPHLATSAFEVGNQNLNKEIATGFELAYRHRHEGHFLTGNLFYTDYDNYIFEQATGEVEDGLDVFEFIGEDATFKGFEIQAGTDVARVGKIGLSADGLIEYVRAETDSGNLPRIPPLSVLVGAEAEWDDMKFRTEIDHATKQKKIADNELPTESYTLLNAFLTWKVPTEQDVKLKLSVLNLLNEEARQHTSFLKDVVPLPGRNIRMSMSAKF